jgi:hypothetical protein
MRSRSRRLPVRERIVDINDRERGWVGVSR